MRIRKKSWALPYLQQHPEIVTLFANTSNSVTLPSINRPIHLEIGCGKGNFLLTLASNQPETVWIGIEQQPSVIALATKKIFENGQSTNVFLWNADLDWIKEQIPDQSISAIYLNFSDPWPKARHEKRRLTSLIYSQFYGRVLKNGGRVYIKTDNESLYLYTRNLWPSLGWKTISDECNYNLDDHDALTEYESKFRAQGIQIKRLIYEKE
jgi:tRNA (guanine-N7-)-methyltransferase